LYSCQLPVPDSKIGLTNGQQSGMFVSSAGESLRSYAVVGRMNSALHFDQNEFAGSNSFDQRRFSRAVIQLQQFDESTRLIRGNSGKSIGYTGLMRTGHCR
jgi:hypothetical protein